MATRKPITPKKPENEQEPVGDVVMSLRLEAAMHDRLRKLAFERRQPMRDFILRGIDLVLQSEGY